MTKTHSVESWSEIDFNSEPFLTDFKQIYEALHSGGCPFAHSSMGDHYAVGSHQHIMDILKQYDVWKSKFGPALGYLETPGVLVSVDPPEHTFEVRIVAECFSKEIFEALRSEMETFVHAKIDAFFGDGEVDLH